MAEWDTCPGTSEEAVGGPETMVPPRLSPWRERRAPAATETVTGGHRISFLSQGGVVVVEIIGAKCVG